MEMNISRDDLIRCISAVARVVESRNTIPILSTIKLVFDGKTLTATATDLEIIATAEAPASGKAFSACVDAKLLADIGKKVSGDVTMTFTDGTVTVKSGRSRFKLNALAASDFPDMKEAGFDAEFSIDLAALFAPCMFAISTEETRYYLNGVFVHVDEGGKLRAVATDGHRLSLHEVELPEGADTMPAVIVPRKVSSILPKGDVSVSVGKSAIRIVSSGLTLVSKLVDGTFPDYKRVVPKDNDKIVTSERVDLSKAAERVTVVSQEKGRAVKLSIASGSIGLSVSGAEAGEASDEVEASYTGEPIEIGFNSRYLAEALGVLPNGPVNIAISDPSAPALLTSSAFEGLSITLMPMRV
jgi:DNA polymerase III subunit beta